ncbi:MAG: hypothetical protein HQK66_13675, partial [Desulfamplus sp.]|nr:hypothetical protein [Desulfamplus sp.]
IIQRHMENPLAMAILKGDIRDGQKILFDRTPEGESLVVVPA